jgi:hypothetical protein
LLDVAGAFIWILCPDLQRRQVDAKLLKLLGRESIFELKDRSGAAELLRN